jgi:putative DNA primase/helicase
MRVVKGDLTRRSVIGKLDPKVERPELRQFDYDPIADAKDNRGELVAAALTILRAYQVAGGAKQPPRLQSFEQWSDTLRGAPMWFGADDPTGTMNRLRRTEPLLGSLTAVLHAWFDAFRLPALPCHSAANLMPRVRAARRQARQSGN